MSLQELMPWRWGGLQRTSEDTRPMSRLSNEIAQLHDEMEHLFEDFWRSGARGRLLPEHWMRGQMIPAIDQSQDEKAYHIRVDLPGLDQKDVEVSLSDGLLTIRGEKKQDEEEKSKEFYRRERSFGSFTRVLTVPGEIDDAKITASFDKGVLRIELPKSESAQKKVKHIDISAAA
jgi:HSP20 family protein